MHESEIRLNPSFHRASRHVFGKGSDPQLDAPRWTGIPSHQPRTANQVISESSSTFESTFSKIAGWFVIWVMVLGFTAAALLFLIHGMAALRQSLRTHDWPETPGTILQSAAVFKFGVHDDADHYCGWRLTYEYQVDGCSSTAGRYVIGCKTGPTRLFSTRSQTYDLVEGVYHAGDAATVRFDPAAPQSAVLSAGPTFFTLAEVTAGAQMTGLIAVVLIRSRAARLNAREADHGVL